MPIARTPATPTSIVIATAAMLAILTSPARAADIPAVSAIDAVTVFPQGAEVTRVAKVRIERGDHVVVLTDLTGQAQGGSIRVEGRATGRLDIGAVDHRVTPVASTDAAQSQTEVRRLEKEIERLKDERAVLQAIIDAAEAQKQLVSRLTELPTHPAPAGGSGVAPAVDWAQIFTLIGSRMAEAQKTILGAQVSMREVDQKIADLSRQKATAAPRIENRTEVRIAVLAAEAVDGEISVRYMVSNAAWQPHYDARLSTGGKSTPAKLTLARRAAITQRTGEAWDSVALTLSTARPAAGAAAPELRPWIVDFVENLPKPMPPAAAAPAAPVARSMTDRMAGGELEVEGRLRSGAVMKSAEQQTVVEAGAFQATFAVRDRVSVAATGEAKRVLVDEAAIEPALSIRTVPRVDAKAYLYAKIALPRTAPYLAGPVSLFRDQTFVGTGRLPQLAPGEEHELGFGADDKVKVRFSVADEMRGESGLISTSKVDARSFRIVLKNGHDRPMAVSVIDQLPVAGNQDIRVEATGRVPTRRDFDDRRGVVAWDDVLKPDEERITEFGYRITWPAARQITHGR